ncbi:ATP-dependent helicase HrpB [Nonomuraea longicatena]|uniref:ATP-dependent RNA helicase n=1 Tax=Nonomuraea longicatena TaxID=83682 RepID=C9W334_9ACTN|nr:ATP-dependent RNA helicase [Nonomuraea longicatena]
MTPIAAVVPALREALDSHGCAVLTAPPGTGKTTVVPLMLAQAGLRVVVAEPRRLAVRAAARRMGASYTIRGERGTGTREPRVEVVTTGVLLQRLQRDPELGGVDVVMLDECHERHLDADTALAFLLDVRETLRPDLRLLAASATADAKPLAALLGDAPVIAATGAAHPVRTVWAPPPRPMAPPHGLRVDPAFLSHVASVVRLALEEHDGDVLCFLPGVGEIAKVAASGRFGVDVLQVHGQASGAVQEAVLRPGERRRVVLATSVAESSLTVPGVRVVVDSGLAREPRTDHARGLGSLTTVRASRAAATQRAGRAGREAPGVVYRCWAESERRSEHARPEIALADLTGFALQAACWGTADAAGLRLLDAPPEAAMGAALETLRLLGGLDGHRVTERGRRMAGLGVHPRLARALLDLGPGAAEIVALLSDPLPRDAPDDLTEVLRMARRGDLPRWRQEVRRLTGTFRTASAEPADRADPGPPGRASVAPEGLAGAVVALAFPERVARRRGGGFLMASGTRARLGEGSRLASAEWLAIAVADRPTGSADARVRQAVAIDEATARLAVPVTVEDEVEWRVPPGERRGDVSACRVERLGAIELASRPLDGADVRAALLHGLRMEDVLTWTPAAKAVRDRLAFCRRALGDPWPDVADLVALADRWLEPELSRARRRADLAGIDVASALSRLVPWSERLEAVAPERVEVPSGSRIRIDYSGEQPVLAVKLQELFGWERAPQVAGVPLLVHLLSPAGRPAAVTADLASFWRDGYRAVRAELRGRYPRHPWPEDPIGALPTRRTKPRP